MICVYCGDEIKVGENYMVIHGWSWHFNDKKPCYFDYFRKSISVDAKLVCRRFDGDDPEEDEDEEEDESNPILGDEELHE